MVGTTCSDGTRMTVTPDFALFSEIGEEAAGICDEHWEQPSTCEGWAGQAPDRA
jgi:hypothetical protein